MGHRFEGWFASSAEFDVQQHKGLITCPVCSDVHVSKMPMAPSIGRKGNQSTERSAAPEVPVNLPAIADQTSVAGAFPAPMVQMMEQLATLQNEILKSSEWVGTHFVEEARAIHYGESEERTIHGEATADDAEALAEEGIKIGALPFPVIPASVKN
jgi:hypothetical protein